MLMLAISRAGAPEERDPYWGAQAGWENLTGSPLARTDTWSWSADGVWYPNSPLWNMVLGAGWHWLGYWGLFWSALLSLGLFLWLAWRLALVLGARPLPGLFGMALPLALSMPMLSARATLMAQSLVLISVLFAYRWSFRAAGESPVKNALVVGLTGGVISTLGNWIHLSFMLLAAVIAVMWSTVWWLTPRLATGHRATMSVVGTIGLFLGVALSPYGIALTVERSRAVQEACTGLILEWTSVWDVAQVQWYAAALLAVVAAVAASLWLASLVRSEGWHEPRLRALLPLLLMGLPTAFAGWVTLRFLGLSLLALVPIAAALFTLVANHVHHRTRASSSGFLALGRVAEFTSGRYWTVVLTSVAVLVAPGALYLGSRGARPPETNVIERLPANCLSVTDGAIAGPLILARPDVQVWIDGRADFYGRDHLVAAYRVYLGEEPIPDQATCAIFPVPSWRNQLTRPQAELDADPRWTRIGEADGYILWVKE